MAGRLTRILAIDPGSSQSAWLVLDREGAWITPGETGDVVAGHGLHRNDAVLERLRSGWPQDADVVVIEWTAPRGMPASAELFETMWWAGRFAEAARERRVERLQRLEVKRHLCGTTAAKDGNVRQALIDRFGGAGGKAAAVGLKASPGPLYGIANDVWQALAVAVTYADREAIRDDRGA